MWVEGSEIEIKPRKSRIVHISVLSCIGIGFLLLILNKTVTGVWLWVWNISLPSLWALCVYFVMNLPIVTIGRKGIGFGKKKLYEWKNIKHAFLIKYNNKYHSVHFNVVYDDDKGIQKEANLDVTDYDYSQYKIESIVAYWMRNQPNTNGQLDPVKKNKYKSLLEVLRKENVKEEGKYYQVVFLFLLFFGGVLMSISIDEGMGSRAFVSLVVALAMIFSASLTMFVWSIIMANEQSSFMSQPPMSTLSSDECDELMALAKLHKCGLTHWKSYAWVSFGASVVMGLAVVGCRYFA